MEEHSILKRGKIETKQIEKRDEKVKWKKWVRGSWIDQSIHDSINFKWHKKSWKKNLMEGVMSYLFRSRC